MTRKCELCGVDTEWTLCNNCVVFLPLLPDMSLLLDDLSLDMDHNEDTDAQILRWEGEGGR